MYSCLFILRSLDIKCFLIYLISRSVPCFIFVYFLQRSRLLIFSKIFHFEHKSWNWVFWNCAYLFLHSLLSWLHLNAHLFRNSVLGWPYLYQKYIPKTRFSIWNIISRITKDIQVQELNSTIIIAPSQSIQQLSGGKKELLLYQSIEIEQYVFQ